MTQASVLSQPQTLPRTATCATCPLFHDYTDERGRGWCNAFDRHAFRHHRTTDGCNLALEPLLKSLPVTVMVELTSHELDPDEDYPVPLHCFIVEVSVTQPSQQLVQRAIAALGYLQEYHIVRHWIPQTEDEF